MTQESYAVVLTTINSPTRAVREIQERAGELDARFHIIGDTKTPPDFSLPGAAYMDVAAQQASGFRFADRCPTRHYGRKNIGYLAAIREGASVIIETDDDNIPLDGFWAPRTLAIDAPMVTQRGWCNVYRYFTDAFIWPRGLPLDRLRDALPAREPAAGAMDCPIQQGLADQDPDVDAVYRLILPLPITFGTGQVVLGQGVWAPFNSQNTTWFKPAFPLLYLPLHCSWRVTDIWRSMIAQRILWANDWQLMFHGPTVFQERNEHDLMRDFAEEVPGYLNNERIRKMLEDLPIASGTDKLGENVILCYRKLINEDLIGAEEEALLGYWLDDLSKI